jgi:hypothetical protein
MIQQAGPDDCWPWLGSRNRKGYGRFDYTTANGATKLAHRIALEFHTHRRIPADVMVLHSCDNPACCNPAHLRLGTAADNAADRDNKGRQASGEAHGRAKLTEEQVRQIFADSRSAKLVAADFGIHRNKVYEIRSGIAWKHLGLCQECAKPL